MVLNRLHVTVSFVAKKVRDAALEIIGGWGKAL
jgi:hypothetical protein